MKAREWREQAVRLMTEKGLYDPATDADWMLCDAMRLGRGALRLRMEDELPPECMEALEKWLRTRLTGRPLQYAQHAAFFMGLRFYVDERVLIPRQDTEILCEEALRRMKKRAAPRVLDMCTGSGALAVSMAKMGNASLVVAADIDEGALCVAKKNAEQLGVRVRFVRGDMFSAVAGEKFDVIGCNPPYLSQADMARLQKEVSFEPPLALQGGRDGLDFYRRIALGYGAALSGDGALLMEIGCDQARDVLRLFPDEECKGVVKDYGGLDRVVFIDRKRG